MFGEPGPSGPESFGIPNPTGSKESSRGAAPLTDRAKNRPLFGRAHDAPGSIYLQKGELEQARSELTEAVALAPKYAGRTTIRVWCFADRNEYTSQRVSSALRSGPIRNSACPPHPGTTAAAAGRASRYGAAVCKQRAVHSQLDSPGMRIQRAEKRRMKARLSTPYLRESFTASLTRANDWRGGSGSPSYECEKSRRRAWIDRQYSYSASQIPRAESSR